jgi:RNA polymerase sigma-70 factor (ECF subfamily)
MEKSMVSFCRDEEAAKDGVSQAFVKALANMPMLEAMPEPAMKAWLYAAARNAVIDIKRRERRISLLSAKTRGAEFADPRQGDPAGKATLYDLLGALPDPLRAPVALKYFEDMNATEIGEAMKIPAATVRTRLRTAMRRLRKELN